MGILERLRDETRHLHRKLENDLPVMRPDLQLADYRQLLAGFYGFYVPVEVALARVPGLERSLPDWPQRRKVDWLVRDLTFLGFTSADIHDLPLCARLPDMPGVADALGCLYVLEGSTLGGQIIGLHLQATLKIGPSNGASFFTSYGKRVGAMWKIFQTALESRAPSEHGRIVNGASQTFESILCQFNATVAGVQPASEKNVELSGALK